MLVGVGVIATGDCVASRSLSRRAAICGFGDAIGRFSVAVIGGRCVSAAGGGSADVVGRLPDAVGGGCFFAVLGGEFPYPAGAPASAAGCGGSAGVNVCGSVFVIFLFVVPSPLKQNFCKSAFEAFFSGRSLRL